MTPLATELGPPRWVRRIFWSVVTVEWTVVALLVGVFLMPVWHGPTRQAFIDMLCLDPTTTRYAGGYSTSAWERVRAGDSQSAVLAGLGEPLDRWSHPDDEWWSYSSQATARDNYLERKLKFDRSGRVVEKHDECYID